MPELPSMAAWHHRDARAGFEVLFLRRDRGSRRLEGYSTAVQEGEAWAIRYALTIDEEWVTRSAHVVGQSASGANEVRLEREESGVWRVDGKIAPLLNGCLDVDLEASACTNALPVRRLGLRVGERADAPPAYVRAPTLRVERLGEPLDRVRAAFGSDSSARLQALKARYDSDNVLHRNQNIPPAA